jgi:prolipoprotein diacylglyceryl transferase
LSVLKINPHAFQRPARSAGLQCRVSVRPDQATRRHRCTLARMGLSFIPSPAVSAFHIGPLEIHFYALMYLVGITAAILITQRRWRAHDGDRDLVLDVAVWSVPAGIVGGRIYFDITTPQYIPHHWYGVFAVWSGGLGIWGGVALATVVGIWRVRRHHANVPLFMDAVAPGLLVAQAIGRIGNYFNKELYGGPTSLPWGLQIPPAYRVPGYTQDRTFQPTFLYELIFDLALAAALIWLGHHRRIRPPGLFALYVTGYSAYRILEELLRVDPSEHFLGLRLNLYIASALTVAGAVWFLRTQRTGRDLRQVPERRDQGYRPDQEDSANPWSLREACRGRRLGDPGP